MNLVSLVSSGIDSPVATYLSAQQAKKMILVHADTQPFTDDQEVKNFFTLAHHLHSLCPQIQQAVIVPHNPALIYYKDKAKDRFTCVFCKRMLVRYAEAIALQHDCSAIIMGDSLGQVASQTLYNLRVVESAVEIPVLRPLIGMDKEDITRIAKDIGTYDLSIQPSQGCKAVPAKPATHTTNEQIQNEERSLAITSLVQTAIKNSEVILF